MVSGPRITELSPIPGGASGKEPNAGVIRDEGSIPGGEDPLEQRMGTHSSILACRIPRAGEPGGLQCIGLQRVGHD